MRQRGSRTYGGARRACRVGCIHSETESAEAEIEILQAYLPQPLSEEEIRALVVAAIVLYIPANILPIMTYASLGEVYSDTIFSGVIELLKEGLWGVAVVVFVASIIVPITKLVILIYLIWSVRTGVVRGAKHRAVLYRLTEVIGRWSMVDVFVVTMLVSLVQFGFIYTVEPEGALIAFGAVVILTMVAAETFDPRLIWDVLDEKNP